MAGGGQATVSTWFIALWGSREGEKHRRAGRGETVQDGLRLPQAPWPWCLFQDVKLLDSAIGARTGAAGGGPFLIRGP